MQRRGMYGLEQMEGGDCVRATMECLASIDIFARFCSTVRLSNGCLYASLDCYCDPCYFAVN